MCVALTQATSKHDLIARHLLQPQEIALKLRDDRTSPVVPTGSTKRDSCLIDNRNALPLGVLLDRLSGVLA